MLMYFHLSECGDLTIDEEGRELPDLAAAREVAIRDARAVMCAELADGRLRFGCHIDIADETGAVLLRVPFSEAVAISGA